MEKYYQKGYNDATSQIQSAQQNLQVTSGPLSFDFPLPSFSTKENKSYVEGYENHITQAYQNTNVQISFFPQ